MKKSRRIVRILCLYLAFVVIASVMAGAVYAKSQEYTYNYGSASMELLSYKVSARLKSDNSANLLVWGAYQYTYTDTTTNKLETSDWVSVSNYNAYGTDTGANGWGTTTRYSACSLHNRFFRNSLLVLDKYLYI